MIAPRGAWIMSELSRKFLKEQQYLALLEKWLDGECQEETGTPCGGSFLDRLKLFLAHYSIDENTNPELYMFFMEKWL